MSESRRQSTPGAEGQETEQRLDGAGSLKAQLAMDG